MDHTMPGMGPGHRKSPPEPTCNMNMLFTWDTTDLCIVFRSWHIRSTPSLLLSLLAVALLSAGYELVREITRQYEGGAAGGMDKDGLLQNRGAAEANSLLWAGRDSNGDGRGSGGMNGMMGEGRSRKTVKGLLYALQVFYSFFIMLLFMTYNGWVMMAVAVGAFMGYMAFGNSSAARNVACH